MAEIVPLPGLRYNTEAVKNLADVVTPPYDIIDSAAQERYYRRHPHNIIRLEYGKTKPGDTPHDNRYTRAASFFRAWREKGVFVQDIPPALYLYEQEFELEGTKMVRTGFTCGVKLEPYARGVVLPHEETIPKHKADRLELLRACRANFSPIFGLYTDEGALAERALRGAAAGRSPDVHFTDEWGEVHRLWVIADRQTIKSVQGILAGKRIYIADGHHRYETALTYMEEMEAFGQKTSVWADSGEPAYRYVMMTLVNLYDPGLVILPTHRLIAQCPLTAAELLERLAGEFAVEEVAGKGEGKGVEKLLSSMKERHRGGAGVHAFGMYAGDGVFYLLTVKDWDRAKKFMPAEKSPAWQNLDVSILHKLIIERHLGIGEELWAKGEHLAYTRCPHEAVDAVDARSYRLAFFLNPTPVEDVIAVAAAGEKMPQKSTYFYPKLITGLVINPV